TKRLSGHNYRFLTAVLPAGELPRLNATGMRCGPAYCVSAENQANRAECPGFGQDFRRDRTPAVKSLAPRGEMVPSERPVRPRRGSPSAARALDRVRRAVHEGRAWLREASLPKTYEPTSQDARLLCGSHRRCVDCSMTEAPALWSNRLNLRRGRTNFPKV